MRPGVCLAQRDVGAPGDSCWRRITAKAVFLPLGPIWGLAGGRHFLGTKTHQQLGF